jgi:hypothetical protein
MPVTQGARSTAGDTGQTGNTSEMGGTRGTGDTRDARETGGTSDACTACLTGRTEGRRRTEAVAAPALWHPGGLYWWRIAVVVGAHSLGPQRLDWLALADGVADGAVVAPGGRHYYCDVPDLLAEQGLFRNGETGLGEVREGRTGRDYCLENCECLTRGRKLAGREPDGVEPDGRAPGSFRGTRKPGARTELHTALKAARDRSRPSSLWGRCQLARSRSNTLPHLQIGFLSHVCPSSQVGSLNTITDLGRKQNPLLRTPPFPFTGKRGVFSLVEYPVPVAIVVSLVRGGRPTGAFQPVHHLAPLADVLQ